MEQLIFIVIVVVVGLVNLISKAVENRRNAEAEKRAGTAPPRPSPAPPPRGAAPDSEEERVRKFLEALGVPTSNVPPPKPGPRAETPAPPTSAPRKILPVDPFPIPRTRAETPRSSLPPPPLPPQPAPVAPPPLTRKTPVAAALPSISAYEVQDAWTTAEAAAAPVLTSSVRDRLRTAQGLRDAIVLREIFGAPRSMQPFGAREGWVTDR